MLDDLRQVKHRKNQHLIELNIQIQILKQDEIKELSPEDYKRDIEKDFRPYMYLSFQSFNLARASHMKQFELKKLNRDQNLQMKKLFFLEKCFEIMNIQIESEEAKFDMLNNRLAEYKIDKVNNH